ncbi:MAG: Phosphate transporter, periplasmic phosphate-binding protein PstS [Rhodospirillales bacterium]|nr:Phosphate transporter, periplasmic phosphate-binding protein PstS [Rhodospirillales bacterium]
MISFDSFGGHGHIVEFGTLAIPSSRTHLKNANAAAERAAYALQNMLTLGQVENAHGLFVGPTPRGVSGCRRDRRLADFKDFSVLMTDAGGPDAFPITMTFILMYKSAKEFSQKPNLE